MAKKVTARTSTSIQPKPARSPSSTTSAATVKSASATELESARPTAQPKPSVGRTRLNVSSSQADTALQEVLNRLDQHKIRCVDVETSGLDWRNNHIVGYVLSFGPSPADSYYVPFRHLGSANVGGRNGPTTPYNWDGKLAPGEDLLLDKLDQRSTMMFGHNMGFDLKFLARTGRFKFRPRVEDTIVNAPLINEFQPKFSLEYCAQVNGVQAKKSSEIVAYLCSKFPEAAKEPKKAMGHYWRLAGDDPVGVEYAKGDGVTTWQLRDKQMLEIEKVEYETVQGQRRAIPSLHQVWDVESRLIPVLARMSVRGIKIDERAFSRLRKEVKERVEQLMNGFPSGFNPRSGDDVRGWMEQHGHTDWPMTEPTKRFPNGNPSMAKGWLENHEAGQKIVTVRKLETLRDTFMLPLQTEHLHNGRVHTTYNQLRGDEFGTITGRLSSNAPNLQAVPKHDEEIGRLFRTIFVPDEGMTWAGPDFNQVEPRLLAYYSRSKVLMKGYLSDPPLDAHTSVAIACRKDWHQMDKAAQKQYRNEFAKRINQTIITGGGKGVLVSKYKVDPNKVDEVWNQYFRAMPEVRTIQKRMQARMEQNGYIRTLLDRRCRLRDKNKSYVALNRALQGGNADIIKLKMVEISEYLDAHGEPIHMLNNCHDAIDFQFSEDQRRHYGMCLEIMQDFSSKNAVIQLDVPITVDGGEGKNWAIATYGEQK